MNEDTIYRIVSPTLRAKGEKIESLSKARMVKRCAWLNKYMDPEAKVLAIPRAR